MIQPFLKRWGALQFGAIFGNLKANSFFLKFWKRIILPYPSQCWERFMYHQTKKKSAVYLCYLLYFESYFRMENGKRNRRKKEILDEGQQNVCNIILGNFECFISTDREKTRGEILLRISSMVHVVMSPLFWSVCFCFSFVDFLLFFETKLLILEFLLVNLFMYMHTFFCFSVFLFLIRWFKSYRTSVRYIDDFWLWETHRKWERFIVRIFSYIIFDDSLSFLHSVHIKKVSLIIKIVIMENFGLLNQMMTFTDFPCDITFSKYVATKFATELSMKSKFETKDFKYSYHVW